VHYFNKLPSEDQRLGRQNDVQDWDLKLVPKLQSLTKDLSGKIEWLEQSGTRLNKYDLNVLDKIHFKVNNTSSKATKKLISKIS
jgi:hypothetical protein